MGLYNFQKRFVPFILSGAKQHTIRATRKNPDKVGNTAHLFTGLRTKQAMLLGRYPITKIEDIEICAGCDCHEPLDDCPELPKVVIAGDELSNDECEKLARLDGFESFEDMATFWEGRLPFKGTVTHWKWNPFKQ